jgi:hypothetical protein
MCPCWDLYRKGQIYVLERVQWEEAKFAYHTNELNWEVLTYRRKISHICAVFIAYCGERAWKTMDERLERHYYMRRVDHERKFRNCRGRLNIGKYYFVNKTIRLLNRLPAEGLGSLPCESNIFRKRFSKVKNVVN